MVAYTLDMSYLSTMLCERIKRTHYLTLYLVAQLEAWIIKIANMLNVALELGNRK